MLRYQTKASNIWDDDDDDDDDAAAAAAAANDNDAMHLLFL